MADSILTARQPRNTDPDLEYEFIVEGKVVPYARMTQRSKYVNRQARRYLQWKKNFAWELKRIMLENRWEMIPKTKPLHIEIRYYLPGERDTRFDLSNVIKGVEDAAQGVVFENDREVDQIVAWRMFGEPGFSTRLFVWTKEVRE